MNSVIISQITQKGLKNVLDNSGFTSLRYWISLLPETFGVSPELIPILIIMHEKTV